MTTAQVQALPINRDPEILGGTPVFKGTRVPVATIFEWLADGSDLDEFLDNFPTVSRESALQILSAGKSSLLDLTLAR
jgi:uncharacterized protein (DUF433 family)